MRKLSRLSRGVLIASAALVAAVVATTASATTRGHAASCPAFNSAALKPRNLPADLGGQPVLFPPLSSLPSTSAALGTKQALKPHWFTDLMAEVTPAVQQQICAKHLSAVYLDWDSVPFNQAIRAGIKDVANALGISIKISNYSFNPSGFAGNLAAVLPTHPNIIMTGGAISPEQFGTIMNPAVKQGATVTTWGLGAKTWNTGPGQPLKTLVAYDFYHLGTQLADAIHKAYPNGANFGYIHWVTDSLAIINREQGMLDGLKKYANIKIVTNGTPSPKNASSGYTDFNAAEAYTVAFLKAHPTVNVLFAPWEDPPALGEAAAINALHLQNKVHIATMDLGSAGATQISHNGIISVDMAQDMYDGGRAMMLSAALSEVGKKIYPYVIVPTTPAAKANVKDAWDFMHGASIPCGSACK